MTYRKKSEATRVHQGAARSRIAIEQRLPTPFLVSIDLQMRVTTVSVRTVAIVYLMKKAAR